MSASEWRASEIMTPDPITVTEDTPLHEAAELMLENRIGSVLVVDERGRLSGLLTEDEFCARLVGVPFSNVRAPQVLGRWLGEGAAEPIYRSARSRPVEAFMAHPVFTVAEGDSVEDVIRLMMEERIKHLPVVRDGEPVGILTRHDLLKLLVEAWDEPAAAGAPAR